MGGCSDVIRKLQAIKQLAAETDQLRVGAIIDRDNRTDEQATALAASSGAHVLPVHEVENFFLDPVLLSALITQSGNSLDPHLLIRGHSDATAGRWILDEASTSEDWRDVAPDLRAAARELTWEQIAPDIGAQASALTALDTSGDAAAQARRRVALTTAAQRYGETREDHELLWARCHGKEVMTTPSRPVRYAMSIARSPNTKPAGRSLLLS